eukprot:tig00000704_g3344.t1
MAGRRNPGRTASSEREQSASPQRSRARRRANPAGDRDRSDRDAAVPRAGANSPVRTSNGGYGGSAAQPMAASSARQPSKLRNFAVRSASTFLMIVAFFLILYAGHVYVAALVIGIQILSFKEIIGLKCAVIKKQERRIPYFKTIHWYFLATCLFFVYGKGALGYVEKYILASTSLKIPIVPLVRYHFFISFALYVCGFMAFVWSLRDENTYKYQFQQFAWIHMVLLIVVVQSNFMINNVYEGLIWFVLPASLVIMNDITAYLFGYFLGRHPLIKLSPKKTWEGFIGGMISTLIFGFFWAKFLTQFDWMICPRPDFLSDTIHCDPDSIFSPQQYRLPAFMSHVLGQHRATLTVLPIQLHSLIFAFFASIVAPFGGFFASGFKRAFKLKDFSGTIPGHGGITDRMDCQFITGLFAYVYHLTFIRSSTIDVTSLLNKIMRLPASQQMELYQRLHERLSRM